MIRLLFTLILLMSIIVKGGEDYPKIVKYDVDKSVELKSKPKRIFVGYVGAMDILSDILPVENIVAAPQFTVDEKYSNCVDFAKKVSIIYNKLDVEIIYQAKPDLMILASFNDLRFVEQVKRLKIPYVLIRKHDSFQDILMQINLLGELVGEEEKARTVVNKFVTKRDLCKELGKTFEKKKVMTFGVNQYTAGSNTAIGDMIEISNLENISASKGIIGHKKISMEELLAWNPDWIIVESDDPNYKTIFLNKMKKVSGVNKVNAIKLGNIMVLHPKIGSSVSQEFMNGVVEMLIKIHGCPKEKLE